MDLSHFLLSDSRELSELDWFHFTRVFNTFANLVELLNLVEHIDLRISNAPFGGWDSVYDLLNISVPTLSF